MIAGYVDTRGNNGITLSKKEFYNLGLVVAKEIYEYCPESELAYKKWLGIFGHRNNAYGTNWVNLGLCAVFTSIYVKYYRYQESHGFDAICDIFGYTVMALSFIKSIAPHLSITRNDFLEFSIDDVKILMWDNKYIKIEEANSLFLSIFRGVMNEHSNMHSNI